MSDLVAVVAGLAHASVDVTARDSAGHGRETVPSRRRVGSVRVCGRLLECSHFARWFGRLQR